MRVTFVYIFKFVLKFNMITVIVSRMRMFMHSWEISKCTNVQNDNVQRYIKYPQCT